MLNNLPGGGSYLGMDMGVFLNDSNQFQIDSDEYEDYQPPTNNKKMSLNYSNNDNQLNKSNQMPTSKVNKPCRYQTISLVLCKWVRFAEIYRVTYCLASVTCKYLFNLSYNSRYLRTFKKIKTDFLTFKLSNYHQCIENKRGKLILNSNLSHLKSYARLISKTPPKGQPNICLIPPKHVEHRLGSGFHYSLSEKKINPILHKYHQLYYWEIKILKLSDNPRPLINVGIASSNIDISHTKRVSYARVPCICALAIARGQLLYPQAPSVMIRDPPQVGDTIGFLLDYISDNYNGCIRIFKNKVEIKYSWYSDISNNKNATIYNVYNNEPFIKDLKSVEFIYEKTPPLSLFVSEYKTDKMPKFRLNAYYKLKFVQKPSIPPKYNYLYQMYQKRCQVCRKMHGECFYVYSKSQKRRTRVKCRIKICPCHQCYVCSKRCQKIAWKNGHKDSCRLRKRQNISFHL